MRATDIFGFLSNDLEGVRHSLEVCLQIRFVPHESSFRGDYYLYADPNGKELLLEMNMDPEDGEPFYSDFSEYPVLLIAGYTTRLEQLAKLLHHNLKGCKLLRYNEMN